MFDLRQKIQRFAEFFTQERLIGIILFCFLISFFVFLNLSLSILCNPIDLSKYNLNEYTISFFNPYKYITFIQYFSSLIIIAVFSLFSFKFFQKAYYKNIKIRKISVFLLSLYTILMLNINSHNIIHVIIALIIFLIILFYCFDFHYSNIFSGIINFSNKKFNFIFWCLSVLVIVQFFSVFYPFIFEKVKVINEFFDIPETTLIKTDKGILEIDNIAFINKNHIIGIHNKYDIRKSVQKDNIPCFKVNDLLSFSRYIKTQSYQINIMNSPQKMLYPSSNYYFTKNNNYNICFIGQISDADIKNITMDKVDINTLKNQQKEIHSILKEINYKKASLVYALENPIEYKISKDFIKYNKQEFHWQILNRYYIHHQNHLISPVNDILTGKDINKIFFQYGKFSGLMIAKILDKLGGFDFTKYMQVTYSFYYIYVAVFAVLTALFFKNKVYFLSWLLLTVASFNFLTDEFLRIAPGTNPMRHFFDIFVLLFCYLYFKKQSKIYLITSLLLSLIAILNETMTGLFISMAIIGSLFAKNFVFGKKNIFEISSMLALPVLGYFVKKIGESGIDYATGYFHLGLLGFSTTKTTIAVCFTLITLGYVVLLKQFSDKENQNNDIIYFDTICFFYVQCLLFYFMWGSDFNHLLVYFPMFVFVVLLFIYHSVLRTKYEKIHNSLISFIAIFSLIFYGIGVGKYYKSLHKFNKIFKTHKVYEWTMPHTNFISTMNPEYFEDSVKLIQKYSPNENGIYIISKYDSLLPVISGKHSNMPFFEVSNFLTSKKEVDLNIDTLKTDKPEYLFVDKDIDRNFEQDIVYNEYELKYLFYESMWRYQRLSLLKDIFNSVKNDYQPIESSYLLTVWELKNK